MKSFSLNNLTPKKRALLVVIALLLILGIATSATFAWLWYQSETLHNDFTTTNNLNVTIGESDAEYLLMPNTPIAKDPSVHIDADQEPSYVFMKVNESAVLSDYVDYYIHSDWQQYGSFVVDGKLDPMYDNADGSHRKGWYFNSCWPEAYPGLEAYYSDTDYHSGDVNQAYYNGNAAFADTYQPLADVLANGVDNTKAQHAMELWVAYDHDYVYLYTKIYDNDYRNNRGVYVDGNNADNFSIYWDPDPESRQNVDYSQYPDIFTEEVLLTNREQQFNRHDDVPTQGDAEIRFYPADERPKVNGINVACNTWDPKPGYGSGNMFDYFYTQNNCQNAENPNAVFFEFKGDIKGNAAAKDTLGGYGYEIRLPRNNSYYDTKDGKPYFKLSVAAASYNADYDEQMTLAFGQGFWLWYGSMIDFVLDDENNPFITETGIYYKTVGSVEEGLTTEELDIPVLRSGTCYGDDFTNGYVYVKDNVTGEMIDNVGTNATLQFDTYIIQQLNLTLEQAYHQAVSKFNAQ